MPKLIPFKHCENCVCNIPGTAEYGMDEECGRCFSFAVDIAKEMYPLCDDNAKQKLAEYIKTHTNVNLQKELR